jgi:peptidoglycan hydrolase-like protein with peptidoglycan-binding domain
MSNGDISRADKSRITRLNDIDSAFVMLFLVETCHTEQVTAFPRELILAICWEESFFQNIPQFGGPAVGYGQLESSGRRIANQHLTRNPGAGEGAFSAGAILGSRETSIRAISHCLAGLFERLGNSQLAALNGYAGVKQRPQNAPIPGRWKSCATALRNVLSGGPSTFNPIAFENALREAREFETSGPVYNHIHSRLWPLLDVLQGLVNQVQIGSQGAQVMMVQDSMNRFQNVDASSGQSFPLLAIDGQFGPKTHARVKEFQAKNSLVPDGIVGPRTRGAMTLKAQRFSNA